MTQTPFTRMTLNSLLFLDFRKFHFPRNSLKQTTKIASIVIFSCVPARADALLPLPTKDQVFAAMGSIYCKEQIGIISVKQSTLQILEYAKKYKISPNELFNYLDKNNFSNDFQKTIDNFGGCSNLVKGMEKLQWKNRGNLVESKNSNGSNVSIASRKEVESIVNTAHLIAVRIEGATQGSGILVKRDGNRFTVLTAWHVVSGQKPGEEIDIYTSDGQRHPIEQGSIKRLGEVDMAVMTFVSPTSYEVARVGNVSTVRSGDEVLVAGFPTSNYRKLKYDKGILVANAAVGIDQGYQLLYTNETISGMSGGVILKADGTLIGMHGRGELDEFKSQQYGRQMKTGINQGVPISYYSLYAEGLPVALASKQASTADDYLAQAQVLLGKKGSEQEVIRLATQVLAIKQTSEGYFQRAYAKSDLGDMRGAITDYNQAITLNPLFTEAYINRGILKQELGDKQGAIVDFNKAIKINPNTASAYNSRGASKSDLGKAEEAIIDFSEAIRIDPQFAEAYNNRGSAKSDFGDQQGAISDLNQAIKINHNNYEPYYNRGISKQRAGDRRGAISDYTQAIALNPLLVKAYINRGLARSVLGDAQGAISDYSKAISIDSQSANAWAARGLAKYNLGDHRGACDDLRISASLGDSTSRSLLSKVCH